MTAITRLTLLPIERKDIEHQSVDGRQYLTEYIADLARLWITEGKPSKAELTISGYDNDPRELYEIPEVCQWANWIANEFPVLPFFLTDTSLDRFAGWLCGPVSREALTSPEFGKKFTDTKMKCVTKAIAESSEFLKKMGADGPTISKFYFQNMAIHTTQEEQWKEKPEEPQTSLGKTILKAILRFFLWGIVSSSIFALLSGFLFAVPVNSSITGCVGIAIGTFFFFDTFRHKSNQRKKKTNDKAYSGVKQIESQKRDSESIGITATQKKMTEMKRGVEPTPKAICPKCGNIGLPKDKFCRKCGSPIKSEIHCKKCGSIVQPKDLFCVKCGSHLGSKNVAADHNEFATPVQKQSSKSIPPISPEQQQKTPVARANPFTTDVVIKSGTLLFKCPTCPSNISVPLQNIDPIVGISVLCSSCKYISHVPGIYKTESIPPNIGITGSIRVPIVKLWDWYYEHPFIVSLIQNGDPTLLYDYGLWAFCGACYHQFPATVLISFIMSHRAGELTFFAQTPDSAKDMNSLRDGHCSHCQHKELIVVVSEIPDYVRNIITSKRK